MRLFRCLSAALCLAAVGASTLPAHAGTITVTIPTWTNRDKGSIVNKFNREDCLKDATATFGVTFAATPNNAVLEVWSGSGCDAYMNRSSTSSTKTCVQVVSGQLAPINQTITVHLRDMVAAYGTTGDQSIDQCDDSTTAGLQNRSLYFVVADPSSNATVSTGPNSKWDFSYDVKAPGPPTAVSAGSGDSSLVTSFTAPSGETNLRTYHFYCSLIGDPPADTGGTGGTGGGTDVSVAGAGAASAGGAASDADTDTDTASSDPECTSSVLIPGKPAPDSAIDCGSIGAQGAKGGETDPVLDNDVRYAVAVATEDTLGNIGVLSKLACNTPKDTTGFYEAYSEAGGRAGGGFCTFRPAPRHATAMGLVVAAAACALWRRRR
jgi:hypothetical protein